MSQTSYVLSRTFTPTFTFVTAQTRTSPMITLLPPQMWLRVRLLDDSVLNWQLPRQASIIQHKRRSALKGGPVS